LLCALFDGDRTDLARVDTEPVDIGEATSLSARVYVPEPCLEGMSNPGLVYYHGGGCVIGDLDTHDAFCRRVAACNACSVISVAYRLAPEWRYPVPLLDAIAGWNWVCSRAEKLGLDLSRTGVGGDSAGGLLATSVCQQYLKPSLQVPVSRLPAFQWLIYPWLDCRQNTESARQCNDEMLLTRATMSYFIGHYLGGATPADDPGASPLLCEDLAGMPPTYLATAGFDPLKDEGRIYARRLAAAKVSVRRDHFEDVMHGFIGLCGVCPSSERYIVKMIQQLRELQEETSV
jgi:acetyl esterase